MSRNLFSEFEPSNKTIWQDQIAKEVTGTVTSGSYSGLENVEPYYTQSELNSRQAADMQSCQKHIPGWLNLPLIPAGSDNVLHNKLNAAISSGADGTLLDCTYGTTANPDFTKILHGIKLSETPFFFQTREQPDLFFENIAKTAPYHLKGGIASDPIAEWMRTGKPFHDHLSGIIRIISKTDKMRDFYPLMVENHVFHHAGATPVQELALMTGTLVAYLDLLTDAGITAQQAFDNIFLSVSVGTGYLAEIAKLRALRFLHTKIGLAYGLKKENKAFIHARTSSFYDSDSLPHTNMLRSTTEAMSAVIGGCDALTVQPYNQSSEPIDAFSERIARNTSLLISNESYVSHVADPAAGSYYIENLSIRMTDEAWALFLKSEKQGGIIASFEKGFIQEEIEKSWNAKIEAMQNDRVMVGVNKFLPDNEISQGEPKILLPEKLHPGPLRLLPQRNLAEFWNKNTGKL